MSRISGFYGVYFHKAANKWAVQIRVRDKIEWLGLFDNVKEAAKAYDKRAREVGKKKLNCVNPNDPWYTSP